MHIQSLLPHGGDQRGEEMQFLVANHWRQAATRDDGDGDGMHGTHLRRDEARGLLETRKESARTSTSQCRAPGKGVGGVYNGEIGGEGGGACIMFMQNVPMKTCTAGPGGPGS